MDKNGVSLIGNEDMDNIKVWVSNTTPIPVTFSDTGSKESKKKSRILPGINASTFASLTTLEEIIPNGFMLLHNDLQLIIENLSKSKSGGFGTALSAGAIGGVVGSAASGLISGLFSGLGDKSKDHLAQIADELNMDLTADDFRGIPEVEQVQKESFINYLKMYYMEQIAAMAGQAVGSFASSAVITFFEDTLNALFGAFNKDKEPELPGKLESIAIELDKDLTLEYVSSDSELMEQVRTEQKKAVLNYIKVYYAEQVAGMAGKTAGSFVGGIFSGLIEGTIGTLVNIFTGRKEEATSLAKIAEELTNSIKVSDYASNEEVLEVQKNAIVNYLKVYYAAQISELTADTIGSTISGALSSTITGLISGVIGGVFGIFAGNDKEQSSKLGEIAEELTANMKSSDYINDDGVKESQRNAVVSYLKVYYASQVAELGAEGVGSTIGTAISTTITTAAKGIISGIFSIFGGEKEAESSTQTSKLQDIVKSLDNNLKAEDYVDDSAILDIQKQAIISYVKLYYDLQIDELENDNKNWLGDALGKLGEGIGNFFSGLFGKKESSPFMNAIQDIINIDSSKFKNMPEINSVIKNHLIEAISAVLNEQNEAILDWFSGDVDEGTKDSLKDFRKAYNAAFTSSVGSIDMSNLFGGAQSNKDSNVISIKDKVTTINIRLLNILNAINELNAKLPAVTVVPVPAGSQNEDLDLLEG